MQVGTGYPERRISAPIKPNSANVGPYPHPHISHQIPYKEQYEHHIHNSVNRNPQIQHHTNQPQYLTNISPKSLPLHPPYQPPPTHYVHSPNHSQYEKQIKNFNHPTIIQHHNPHMHQVVNARQNHHLSEEMTHVNSHSASPIIQRRTNSPPNNQNRVNVYFSQTQPPQVAYQQGYNHQHLQHSSIPIHQHPQQPMQMHNHIQYQEQPNQPIYQQQHEVQTQHLHHQLHEQMQVQPNQQITPQNGLTMPPTYQNMPQQGYYGENQEEQMEQYEQEQGQFDTKIWEEKFYEIYSRFQFFVEKFDVIIEEIYIIEEQFQTVSTEEEWNELRTRYTQLINKFNQIRQEVIYVLEANREINARNNQIENEGGDETGKQTIDKNLWEHRYYQILQQHEMLAQEYNKLKGDADSKHKRGSIKVNSDEYRETEKVSELENALNSLHSEYKELEESYNKLSEAYSNAINQIQQRQAQEVGTPQEQIMYKLQSDLKDAEARIQYMEQQLAKKMDTENWQEGKRNEQEIEMYAARIQQLQNQKNSLINNVNGLHEELEKYHNEMIRNEDIINEQNQNLQNLSKEYHVLQEKLQSAEEVHNKLQEAIDIIEMRERQLEEMRNMVILRQKQIQQVTHHKDVFVLQNQDLSNTIKNLQSSVEDQNHSLKRYQDKIRTLEAQLTRNTEQSQLILEKNEDNITQNHEKNRKIKYLEEELQDLQSKHERKMTEKDVIIKQIKAFAQDEEEKLNKKVNEKQHAFKLLQERIRSLDNELANRNLQISRFRPQVNSSNPQEIKKLNDVIDRKNTEIQQLRRQKENKNIQMWEQEQNYDALQIQLNNKTFELNNLKRQVYDLHNYQAEIDSLNNTIKKKNQQINELRLSGIEKQQLKFNIEGLEREKIRLNEYLKEKTRECENKDSVIKNLQQKMNAFTNSTEPNSLPVKYSLSTTVENNENLAKHKESEIKKLKYELDLAQTTISSQEKSIKDLNKKLQSRQKTHSLLKVDIENKVTRYEQEVKVLQKQIKDLKKVKYDNGNLIESQKVKISSLEKSQHEGMSLFDKEIQAYKQKQSLLEQANTQLNIDIQLCKNQMHRISNINQEFQLRVNQLQDKLQNKNKQIQDLKVKNSQKQIDGVKVYQQKITQLDGELKLSGVKIKNMEEEIGTLNKKIKNIESEKQKYKGRLYTETSGQRNQYVNLRQFTQQFMTHSDVNMPKFKLKDAEANDVFERKVIYELKKQNQLLKRQLSGIGLSNISLQRPENQFNTELTQQQIPIPTLQSDRNDEMQELVHYYKEKNRELETLNNQLLRVNKELKEKLSSLGTMVSGSASIDFYKNQVINLQTEIHQLENRVKKLVSENKNLQKSLSQK